MSDKMQGGIKAGSTSVSVSVILRKTADNTEKTGVAAAGVTSAYYWRQGGTPTTITAVNDLAGITSAYAAGGWKEADATHAPGAYRLDVDDAAFATGADWVQISVVVASCYVFHERYPLTTNVVQTGDGYGQLNTLIPHAFTYDGNNLPKVDVEDWHAQAVTLDANNVPNVSTKYWGGTLIVATSIPVGTAAGAAGGLFIAGTNAATTVTTSFTTTFTGNLTGSVGSVSGAVGSVTGNVGGNVVGSVGSVTAGVTLAASQHVIVDSGTVTTVTNQLTAAAIATGVWQDATAGDFTTASSIGKSLFTSGNVPGAASGIAIVGSNMGTVSSVTGAVASVTGNVGGNVVGSVGSVAGAVGSVTGNVGGSVASVVSPVAITSNIKKNQAITAFSFLLTDSTTHAPKPGLGSAVTVTRSIDGGAFGAGTLGAVSEIANGWYQCGFGTGDTNGNCIAFRATAAATDDRDIQLITQA